MYSFERSVWPEQGLCFCYIFYQTSSYWCYQGEIYFLLAIHLFSQTKLSITPAQALHQSQTMEGCSAPLVVKFADTQKEKDAKRIQTMQTNLWNFAAAINPLAQTPISLTSPVTASSTVNTSPFLATDASTAAALPATSLQLLQQLQAIGLQQQLLHGNIYASENF